VSRAALATYCDPVEIVHTRSPQALGCRLLGGSVAGRTPKLDPGPRRQSRREKAAAAPYLEALDESVSTFRSREAGRAEGHRVGVPLRWVGAAVVGLATLFGLLSPVLAKANSSAGQARKLTISGYRDVQASPGSVPLIDASSGPAPDAPAVTQPQPAPAAASSGQYLLTSPPSISVRQIEAVLQQYGSPAVGLGQTLFDLGVKYGIDPAYALAFFVHESGCGTKGVARFTKSLGNIRWTEGYDSFDGYRSYPTWQTGMEDWYKLVTDLYINGWNLRTVDAIVPVYAPAGDGNSPPDYAASVKWMVDNWGGK
jgi:hypothetical protein